MTEECAPSAEKGAPNAGPWEHVDGTPCPTHWATRPIPSPGRLWWCTEHQQHVRTVETGPDSAEKGLPETCPSLCAERSHPGREHDPERDGCSCSELCSMGPTCPGANAGLPRGCHRVNPPGIAASGRYLPASDPNWDSDQSRVLPPADRSMS